MGQYIQKYISTYHHPAPYTRAEVMAGEKCDKHVCEEASRKFDTEAGQAEEAGLT